MHFEINTFEMTRQLSTPCRSAASGAIGNLQSPIGNPFAARRLSAAFVAVWRVPCEKVIGGSTTGQIHLFFVPTVARTMCP